MESDRLISVPPHPAVDRRKRLAVLASGTGTNFERIIEACAAGEITADIVGLVHNVDARCAEVADRHDIPRVHVPHRDFDQRKAFDAAVVAALREWSPDLVVMAGWMRIATATLIDAFPDRLVNVHPSLLPSFRGIDAVEQALAAGVSVAGCSVHLVRLAVDDGPIVGQAVVPVLDGDDAATLHARIQEAEYALYPRAIEALLARL